MKKKSERTKKSLEVWKPIRGLENYFEVSSNGQVKSKARTFTVGGSGAMVDKKDKILNSRLVRNYPYVMLEISDGEFRFRRSVPVHRLVAQEFCENRLGRKEVNHKNGIKTDNFKENLEWVSRSENAIHAYATGLKKSPIGNRKYNEEVIDKVFELRKKDLFHREIAKKLGIGHSTVTHILLGTRRKRIEKLEELKEKYESKR